MSKVVCSCCGEITDIETSILVPGIVDYYFCSVKCYKKSLVEVRDE